MIDLLLCQCNVVQSWMWHASMVNSVTARAGVDVRGWTTSKLHHFQLSTSQSLETENKTKTNKFSKAAFVSVRWLTDGAGYCGGDVSEVWVVWFCGHGWGVWRTVCCCLWDGPSLQFGWDYPQCGWDKWHPASQQSDDKMSETAKGSSSIGAKMFISRRWASWAAEGPGGEGQHWSSFWCTTFQQEDVWDHDAWLQTFCQWEAAEGAVYHLICLL